MSVILTSESLPLAHHFAGRSTAAPGMREAVAGDIALIIRLHDRELDGSALEMIEAADFPRQLGISLHSNQGKAALLMVTGALTGLTAECPRMRQLRKDYLSVYLSPDRLDERGRLRRSGDDLVAQLNVVGQLLAGGGHGALREAVQYLERMIVAHLEPFARMVSARARDPFYPGLALLTLAYATELLEVLSNLVAGPRRALRGVA